ncbi:hypothetical protein EG832_02975 [bacterium]|nr:hypothetical protein [bacterium]
MNNQSSHKSAEEKRAELINQNKINETFSLLFIDMNTKETSYDNRSMTAEQVEKFISKFSKEELRNITVIGMSNVRFATSEDEALSKRIFHQGVVTKTIPKRSGNK